MNSRVSEKFKAKTLCTIEMSQDFPALESYKLKKSVSTLLS